MTTGKSATLFSSGMCGVATRVFGTCRFVSAPSVGGIKLAEDGKISSSLLVL